MDLRRSIPRTDTVLAEPALAAAVERLGRETVKGVVGRAQAAARRGEIRPDEVVDTAVRTLPRGVTGLRPVLNATGVLLHTNLGRAPLSAAAREALLTAAGTCDVELDLTTGGRGRRGADAIAALRAAVPGATGALLVNNGAAALALTAATLAAGREIVVSRGELVEIGDGFRIPELLVAAGARLREVGTTNRTHLGDYESAVGADTGFVLKVHPSNFTVRGFTHSVPVRELAGLGVPLVADIGSGLLAPHPRLPDEPDAASTLAAGATLVTASGDKLLGGPQAGLVLGDAGLVERIRRNPLARAMRVDKLTLAAMEATLRGPVTPTRAALDASAADLRRRAEALAVRLGAQAVRSQARVGGGGAPDVVLESWAVALPEHLAAPLRAGDPAVLGRVEHGRCLLDLRAVAPEDDPLLAAAVRAVG
jgi:L-seryl-tRNA(Ser) seleniumtransferase